MRPSLVLLCMYFVLFASSFNTLQAATTIFGPKKYTASQPTAKKYTENINVSTQYLNANYTIKILNADGKDHLLKICNQSNILSRVFCKIENLVNNIYINNIRVQSFELKNNGSMIISSAQVNKNVAAFTATIKLSTTNKLELSLLGRNTAYLSMEIQREDAPQDSTPPLIGFSLKPFDITNNPVSQINITDASATTTSVYINNALIISSNSKSFSVNLFEGNNDIFIKSVDAYGNAASDLLINQVVLDTKIPLVSSDLQPIYYSSQSSFSSLVSFNFNEPLKFIQINGIQPLQIGTNTYSYYLELNDTNSKNISITAIDLAGNELSQSFTTSLVVDSIPPVIATNSLPSIIIDSIFNLSMTITDTLSTTTEVYINDSLALTSGDKNISYQIPFPVDEKKQIKIVSTDLVGNSSNRLFYITKDTKPLFVNIISPQNRSILSSQIIEVRAIANKPLAVAKINGQIATIDQDQISIKGNLQQLMDGDYQITVEVVDIFSQSAQQSVTITLKQSELASWTYEECPAPVQ